MQKIIEFKNISFSYPDKKIISSLNLEIFKGDFIGIFWENWTGKTTLIKILLWILKPDLWKIIWYDDNNNIIWKNNFNIEYISQKAQMIDNLIPITVRELLYIWNKSKKWIFNHFINTCSYETIEKALNHVNMGAYIDFPFLKLSWWQKQRIFIAKALISNPDIIIMDEPTAWIDLVAQKHFYDLLSHLNNDHNITIILVSHDTKFIVDKIKKIWYLWKNNCEECENDKIHLLNIKMMFKNKKIEFIS
jgi:zinc transport system ATP-binding protein